MTNAMYAQLAALALIDSTSIGTLLIPLWLLLRPDARRMVPRILLYLSILAAFYFAVGIAVLSGAGWVVKGLGGGSITDIPMVQWAMVLGGGAMLVHALTAKSPQKAEVARVNAHVDGQGMPGRDSELPTRAPQVKWQARLSTALRSPGGLVALALTAGLLELPTMLPYLVAVGLLTDAALPFTGELGVLAAYCLVMLLPALLLLLLRTALGHRMDSALERVSKKLGAFAGESILWILGIVGFVLLRGGLSALAPDAPWNPFK